MHLHSKSYDFIPTLLRDEFTALKQALTSASKAERTCPIQEKQGWTNERERLEKLVAQTRSRIERSERENREREVLSRAKKDEREKRKDGKGAWYMKKGEDVVFCTNPRRAARSVAQIQIRGFGRQRRETGREEGYGQEEEEDRRQGKEVATDVTDLPSIEVAQHINKDRSLAIMEIAVRIHRLSPSDDAHEKDDLR